MTEPAYTEQDLREATEFIERRLKDKIAMHAWINSLAAEFSRIRREARAGMREACATHFTKRAAEIASSSSNPELTESESEAILMDSQTFMEAAKEIRSLSDHAADEAIERVKAAARLEEATLWSRDKFHKTHSGYCDTLESHVKECSGCQRIAELSAQAKEMR